jgi:DNA-binding NarL/FixJ family response regulator
VDKIRVWLASNLESSLSSTVLTGCPSLKCVGQSDLSCDALKRIEATQPDVVILEIDAHDRRINRILKRFADTIPAMRIIAHSPTDDKRFVMRLLRHGVHGYLSKLEIATELTRAITTVMQGDVFLCPTASGALVNEYRKRSQTRRRTGSADDKSKQTVSNMRQGERTS